jgi:hypothetical protein
MPKSRGKEWDHVKVLKTGKKTNMFNAITAQNNSG